MHALTYNWHLINCSIENVEGTTIQFQEKQSQVESQKSFKYAVKII